MKKILAHFKRYKRDWGILLSVVAIGLLAVMGQHFSDVAKTPFWWKFWDIGTYVAIAAWVIGWVVLYRKDKKKND